MFFIHSISHSLHLSHQELLPWLRFCQVLFGLWRLSNSEGPRSTRSQNTTSLQETKANPMGGSSSVVVAFLKANEKGHQFVVWGGSSTPTALRKRLLVDVRLHLVDAILRRGKGMHVHWSPLLETGLSVFRSHAKNLTFRGLNGNPR